MFRTRQFFWSITIIFPLRATEMGCQFDNWYATAIEIGLLSKSLRSP